MASSGLISKTSFTASVITGAIVLTIAVIAVSGLRAAEADPAGPAAAAPAPVAVFEVRVDARTPIESRFPGLIAARRTSALGFESGGRVAEIAVDVGDRVEAGAMLARLDTRALDASLAASRAEAAAARARASLAEATLTRQQTLVDRGHISAQALDQARADRDAAAASAAAADAAANRIAVQLDLARLDAPFAGVITDRLLDEGAVAGPGAPILTLVESSALEFRVGLPADEARAVIPGQSYPLEIGAARLDAVARAGTGVVSPGARTVETVFDLAPGAPAESGAVARLILETALEEPGFWAPLTALSEGRRGLWSVYVLAPDAEAFRLEPRPVEILHSQGDRVYLRGAVEAGAQVLAAGVHRVTPGQRVRPAVEA